MADRPVSGPDLAPELEAAAAEIAGSERGFHRPPPGLDAAGQAAVRRRALDLATGSGPLKAIGSYALDGERASTQNCENFIGAAQVPMGVAGPVHVRGSEIDGTVCVPMATTEGALLASVNRGCRAITAAGGATVFVEDVGMTRAPVFRTTGIDDTRRLLEWLEANEERIRAKAQETSRFLELRDIRPSVVGSTVFLRFRFATGDAMGMNMVTIACDRVVSELIEPETGAQCVALSGNYCVDKKPSAVNYQLGRGKRIHAEVVLDETTVRKVLKSEANALQDVAYRKNLLGSVAAGALAFNAQFANVLAAVFVACGQDLAHVVEGAMGVASFEARDDGSVYASVYMPDCPLAAIGGGTGLDTQREALEVMGVRPDAERPGAAVRRLAEIVGAVVLAGELSLTAAFTSRDLARAHERLGRSSAARAG